MRSWLLLLGGLLIWAADFFALYGVASIFPGMEVARYLSLAVTAIAAAAAAWLLLRMLARMRSPASDELADWIPKLAAAEAALALVAILYQGAPALLV